jgi:hypothetical protein
MEVGDEDALLAEAFTTKGLIQCKLQDYHQAQQSLDAAYSLARRCGNLEGAAQALLIIAEEMTDVLDLEKQQQIRTRLIELRYRSQQTSIRLRAKKCLDKLDSLGTLAQND